MLQTLSVASGQMRDHSRQRTAATRTYFADQTHKTSTNQLSKIIYQMKA